MVWSNRLGVAAGVRRQISSNSNGPPSVRVLVLSRKEEEMTNRKTDARFAELKTYCEQEARVDPHDFHCKCFDDCKASIAKGLEFIPGGLAYIGDEYDTNVGGVETRILFVGYDCGRGCADLDTRRAEIQEYKCPLNPHYRGIVKVMMEISQTMCGSEEEKNLWKPLLRKMAQTNAARCCAPRNGWMGTNTTAEMQKNCWTHLRKEIEILSPTLILFHGARLKWPFLRNVQSEANQALPQPLLEAYKEHCQVIDWTAFPKRFRSVLLFFSHPARGHFGNQWESKVAPVLQLLVEHKYLPPRDRGWEPRSQEEWPKI